MKRKLISIFLIIILILTVLNPIIFAQTAQEKKQELENKVSDAEQEKNIIKTQKSEILDEISELNSQIEQYESQIKKLNDKISDLQESIEKNEKEIEKLEKEFEEKQEAFVERMVAIYEAGQTTYLDYLLASDSIVDFISTYYMISEMAEADGTMMDSIKAQQAKIENIKKELEQEKTEVTSAKNEVEDKTKTLNLAKESKQSKVSSLTAQERELQEKIDSFNEAIKEAEEEIRREAQSSSGGSSSYQGSFEGDLSWPLSSSSYGYNYITSVFGPRSAPTAGASTNHGAVDIAVSYEPVYAPASGKVIIARWLSGYGNYILIDHGNGYYTGFGHLSDYNVSKGDTVSRGQQIATSGNTGISTGPHLHYEVHIGGYSQWNRVDPLLYTTHPSLIFW